ncbi:MAG TPA: transglycosylase domain-containing protein [Candidatus Binataceae bacterium]
MALKLPIWLRTMRWRRVVVGALFVGFFAFGFYLAGVYGEISELIEQRRAALTSSVFSAPMTLEPGEDIDQIHLLDRLRRLSYTPVAAVAKPGEYAQTPTRVVIFRRSFRWGVTRIPGAVLNLGVNDGAIADIRDSTGQKLAQALIEPQVIGRLISEAPAERVETPLRDLKPLVVQGLLATEDRYFYYHPGFDPVRIVEAAWADLRARRLVQGASTITQQLARTFLTRQRSFARKFHEAAIALVLEIRLHKDEILERYVNDVPMGDYRGIPIYGLPMAARYVFGKDLHEVTPAEAATLIGMINAPSLYDPRRHPEQSRKRRDTVLGVMRRAGLLDNEQYAAAMATPIKVAADFPVRPAPYFVDYVATLVHRLPGFSGDLQGVTVFTTLDPELQELAQSSVIGNLDRLEKAHRRLRHAGQRLQGSMVAIDARSGAIRAMVGGRDYSRTQFNRVTQAQRQPGSAFKPIVYLTALDPARNPIERPFTLASVLPDRPMSFGGWMPADYERSYRGTVTAVEALADSLNVPTAYLGSLVGTSRMINTAHDLGIGEVLPNRLPLALGAGDTTLLELTSAYQVFADAGTANPPYALEAVVDGQDHLVYQHTPVSKRVVAPAVAYLVTGALREVMKFGTAARSKALGVDFPAAGKTGTTEDYHDAYFIGYTPNLVCGTWVGFDNPSTIGLTGAQAALPAWVNFMKDAVPEASPDFALPDGIDMATIDPDTGGLATPACPKRVTLPFLSGTAPRHMCALHGGFGGGFGTASASLPSPGSGTSALPSPPIASAGPVPPNGNLLDKVAGFFGSLFGHH